jgi:hypothetical protein
MKKNRRLYGARCCRVSTTQAEEIFDWARSLILDSERAKGISEMQARRNAVWRLLSANEF